MKVKGVEVGWCTGVVTAESDILMHIGAVHVQKGWGPALALRGAAQCCRLTAALSTASCACTTKTVVGV